MKTIHTSASRKDLENRLLNDRENRLAMASPTCDIFLKTGALIAALRNIGCRAPIQETTQLSPAEHKHAQLIAEHQSKLRRGYMPHTEMCKGRIGLKYNKHGKPLIV